MGDIESRYTEVNQGELNDDEVESLLVRSWRLLESPEFMAKARMPHPYEVQIMKIALRLGIAEAVQNLQTGQRGVQRPILDREGKLQTKIEAQSGRVLLDFGQPITFLLLPPSSARFMSERLMVAARVADGKP